MSTPTIPPPAVLPIPKRGRRKRGYSRAFPVRAGKGKRYLLDEIPAELWTSARRNARRHGLSMRGLLLQLLAEWNTTA